MNLGDLGRLIRRNTKQHSSQILSAAAGVGVLTTVYLTIKASFQACDIVRYHEGESDNYPVIFDNRADVLIGRTKLVWKLYIPTALSTASTITCIVGANRIEAKKTIAAQTAFAVSQRVFSEYRDKVVEEYGEHKDQAIRDQIADDRVKLTAPPADVLITGPGNVLCCELFTGRYFASDMETLKRSQNDLNAMLLVHDYASLNDFYYMVKLPQTSVSSQLGWKSTKLMKLEFSTVLTEDGRPCLAFEYNYTEPL